MGGKPLAGWQRRSLTTARRGIARFTPYPICRRAAREFGRIGGKFWFLRFNRPELRGRFRISPLFSQPLVFSGAPAVDFQLNLNTDTVDEAGLIEPLCVQPEMTVREVMVLMRQHNTGSALVCRDERLIGIFTERDALRHLATESDLNAPIDSAMAADPVSVESGATLADAIQTMTDGRYRHLPIIDKQGQPTGMLKVRGIVHYFVEHFPQAIYNLPPEPRAATHEREGA